MICIFYKYHAAGNDFILIDDRDKSFPSYSQQFIQNLCHRKFGVGADGLLLLQHSHIADCKMRIFNADGQEASMCGNGVRCLTHFVFQNEPSLSTVRIETKKGIVSSRAQGPNIAVNFGAPQSLGTVSLLGHTVYVVDTGVPHAVIFVNNAEATDVEKLGKEIRYDHHFYPDGVNVNFVQVYSGSSLRVRTYERGVEGETLSCGTGLAAAAFIAAHQANIFFPMSLYTSSKEVVQACQINLQDSKFAVEVIGLATCVYQGKIYIGEQT